MFKIQNSFSSRKALSEKILKMYPDRIPIIVTGVSLSKTKFLVPKDLKIYEVVSQIRGCALALKPYDGLFIHLSDGTIPIISEPIERTYSTHVDDDGFLYLHVSIESVFG